MGTRLGEAVLTCTHNQCFEQIYQKYHFSELLSKIQFTVLSQSIYIEVRTRTKSIRNQTLYNKYSFMHQSFVTTAPPPTGKGGDYDFSVSVPCCKPHSRLGELEVKTFLLATALAIENLPGVRILMSIPRHFPCIAGTLEK